MEALARNVGILSRNNGVMASMLSQLNAGETPSEPKELRIMLQDTGHLARETGELLLRLQQERSRDEAHARCGQRTRDRRDDRRHELLAMLTQERAQSAERRLQERGGGGEREGRGEGVGVR